MNRIRLVFLYLGCGALSAIAFLVLCASALRARRAARR